MTDHNNTAQGNSARGKTAAGSQPAAGRPETAAAGAGKPRTAKAVAAPKPAAKPAAATAAAPARAKAPVARRRSAVDETVDKHQKALADALEQAEAITYDSAKHLKPSAKAGKPAKGEKSAKVRKVKLVRDSFAMPESEYARIGELKKRLAGAFKKSELLRAGLAVLAALNDAELKAVMGRVERIKTGRPARK